MTDPFVRSESIHRSNYTTRTVEYYLNTIDPFILKSFDPQQLQAVTKTLDAAIPRPSPKIVDLRFGVDLIISRFYVVLFVGKEQRRYQRQYFSKGVSRVGNAIATVLLLIGLNLFISLLIFLLLYLVKSALGIDFFPHEHLGDKLKEF